MQNDWCIIETKEYPLDRGLISACCLAEQIVMTDKSLISFSILVRFAVKHSTRPVEIEPFKDEAQTALFKDPVRTAL